MGRKPGASKQSVPAYRREALCRAFGRLQNVAFYSLHPGPKNSPNAVTILSRPSCHAGNLRSQTPRAHAFAVGTHLVRRQRRHLAAPALERLRMPAAVERIAAARTARAAFRAGSGRFHN